MTERPESENENCPQCGAELPEGAPNGLCPRCLMAGAMEPTGIPDQEPTKPPGIEEVQEAFPQLEIIEMIAAGGMGVVYKAKQTALNREVALKLLAPHREKEAGFSERFVREAQALAAMDHPNIVTVHDFGQSGGFYYLVMEFVDGVNLREAMKAGKFEPKEALAIVPPICEALQYAHDLGIVHRDIKPENLLLDRTGKVKVADFGIARILDLSEPESGGTKSEETESQLTVGMTLGTPNYMAPEQVTSPEKVDHRADIYSLGVVFYEMLTGESPKGLIEVPSTRVELDVRLDEIVMRALADSPELRWQTAADLRTEVETVSHTASTLPVRPTTQPQRKNGAVWKGFTIGLGILSVPLVIIGLIALVMVLREDRWNPSRSEGFLVISSWIAAILFSGGTLICLFGWLNSREFDAGRKPWRIACGILAGLGAVILPIVVFGGIGGKVAAQNQRAMAIRAEQKATQQISIALHHKLALLEDQLQNATDPALKKSLKEKNDLLRVELEKVQSANRDQGSEKTGQTSIRLSFAIIFVVGLTSLLLLIASIVLIARSGSGIAIGCGLGALILVIGFCILASLLWTYRSFGHAPSPSQPRTSVRIESVPDRAGPVQVYLSNPGITMNGGGVEIGFDIDTKRFPTGWTIWSVTRKLDLSSGTPKLVSSHPYLLTERKSGSVTVGIRGIQWSDQSRSNFERIGLGLHNHQLTLSSGKPATLFTFRDEKGMQITSSLELRPGGRISDIPGNLIFLREVRNEPDVGKIALAWNDIQTLGQHELVLETRGASVQRSTQDSIELANFEEVIPGKAIEFSRLKIDGGGAFQFTFPPFLKGSSPSVILPRPGRSMFIAGGSQGAKLFELIDRTTGRRATAELKLVPVLSLPEVLPGLEQKSDQKSLFPIPE